MIGLTVAMSATSCQLVVSCAIMIGLTVAMSGTSCQLVVLL